MRAYTCAMVPATITNCRLDGGVSLRGDYDRAIKATSLFRK